MIILSGPTAKLQPESIARPNGEVNNSRARDNSRPRDVVPASSSPVDTNPRDPVAVAEEAVSRVLAKDLPTDQRLSIDRDQATSRVVFSAVDRESGETVKQFPTEETLRAVSRLRDVAGLAVNVDA